MTQPTAIEQELLELINRLRLNPSAELPLLLDSEDRYVKYALEFYRVNRETLKAQWSHLSSAAPLAWASQLQDSAVAHNQEMIAQELQAHVLPGELSIQERIDRTGYQSTYTGENIYAQTHSAIFTHTGFAIDWGNGANTIDGIQTPAFHRQNMLSKLVREVGISVSSVPDTSSIGPLVVTEDFGNRAALDGKAWLLGVAFADDNKDGWYQAGEGLDDVQVKITGIQGTNFSKTISVGQSGGYQELLNPGQYQVDFSQKGRQISSKNTTIEQTNLNNVKIDFVLPVIALGSNLQNTTAESNILDFRTEITSRGASRDLTAKTIALKVEAITADASYHNYAGIYRIEDVNGTVIDPANSQSYRPGESGYLSAALRRAQIDKEGTELDKNGLTTGSNLKGGYMYAPFIVANGRVNDVLTSVNPTSASQVYFNYKAANSDKLDHIQSIGANKFGFEDTFGGGDRDFNDLIFQVSARVI